MEGTAAIQRGDGDNRSSLTDPDVFCEAVSLDMAESGIVGDVKFYQEGGPVREMVCLFPASHYLFFKFKFVNEHIGIALPGALSGDYVDEGGEGGARCIEIKLVASFA